MRVIVLGDVAHVVVDGPRGVHELLISDFGEDLMEVSAHLVGGQCVVHTPDHHRHEADLAVRDPTDLVFVVALGEDGRLAELAGPAHLTLSVTVDLVGTIVPAAGLWETTSVQVVVPAPDPVVVK